MSLIEIKKKLLMAQKGGADISELFNTSLWTGTSAARTITTGIDSGEGALVWIKGRSVGTQHVLVDSIRGAGQVLRSNTTDGNSPFPTSVTAFSASGYALGNYGDVNFSPATYVGWQFRRAEKFFDIVQYTGNGSANVISHNLGMKPGLAIVRIISSTQNWFVYHQSRGRSEVAYLNLDSAFAANTNMFSAEPTDTHFSVTPSGSINAPGFEYIAYLFAHDPAPEGLIQCGSYTGNGSASGPIINLGWRPQYLLIKGTSASRDWAIIDAARGTGVYLLTNSSTGDISATQVSLTATGFQVVNSSTGVNGSGQTYIYMAIREAE